MPRFYIATLGCKINQYESQALREAWLKQGWVETSDPTRADTVLVNSCAVTQKAVRDLRQTVRRAHRDAPDAAIVVTGCAAEVMQQELTGLPGVTEVVPQSRKRDLLPLVGLPDPSAAKNAYADFSISDFERSRPVIKVQDGCSHRCTYCIVPLTRGASASRRPEAVRDEVERLLKAGFRELILSGVNLSHFGRDLSPKIDFWDLVRDLEETFAPSWSTLARFRISSVYPGQLTAKGYDVLRASTMVCPHLHLSLQSGSPDILKAMGRGGVEPAAVRSFLERLTAHWPLMGLGADIIAGFPGETEEQFEESLAFVQSLPLTYAHVFPYSPRPGTKAALLPRQVELEVKKRRAAAMRQVAEAGKQAFLERLAAQQAVHVALTENDLTRGLSEQYADCRFTAPPQADPREVVAARPLCVENGSLLVEPFL